MSQGFYGFPNILGLLRATAFRAVGKPGAEAGAELAGGTTSGAPTTGEHVVGELVVDHSGTLWICTGAGTPGTWTQVVGGSGSYTLPAATTTVLGGIKAGGGLAVETDGTLHAGTAAPPARTWRQSISTGSPTTVTSSTVVSDGSHNAFPGVACTRSGKLICVYRTGTAHVSASSTITIRTSSDGGATWGSATTLATADGTHDYRDPSIVCTQSGRLILSYFRNIVATSVGDQILTTYSDDDGATWSTPAVQTPFAGENVTSGAILQHSTGALVLPVYGNASGTAGAADYPGVVRSLDDGLTWSSLITVTASTNYDEACLVELPGHTIRAYIRCESSSAGLFYADSTDGGLTWSGLTGIGFSAWGGRPAAVLVPVSQELIIFYRHITDQSCAWRYSTDLGATWGAETIINSNAYAYAGACALADGLVGIVYADQYSGLASADLHFLTMAAGVPSVSGSRSGNAALASLLSRLALEGEILDGTTAGTAPPSGLAVSHNGTAVATEAGLNLVDGSNVTLTVADNSGSSRVDVTVASTASTVSSLLVLLPNANAFVVEGTSDEQPPDFITLSSGDVIGVGGM